MKLFLFTFFLCGLLGQSLAGDNFFDFPLEWIVNFERCDQCYGVVLSDAVEKKLKISKNFKGETTVPFALSSIKSVPSETETVLIFVRKSRVPRESSYAFSKITKEDLPKLQSFEEFVRTYCMQNHPKVISKMSP